MKKITQRALGLSAAIVFASANAWASSDANAVFLTVTSPNHPHTWVAGAHQKSATLRWDASRQKLVVDVKYSTQDYADSINPTEEDYHTLAFSHVRLARNGIDLLATNRDGQTAAIGRIEDGFLGKSVVLNSDVNLNVRRVDGRIYASLVYNSLARD